MFNYYIVFFPQPSGPLLPPRGCNLDQILRTLCLCHTCAAKCGDRGAACFGCWVPKHNTWQSSSLHFRVPGGLFCAFPACPPSCALLSSAWYLVLWRWLPVTLQLCWTSLQIYKCRSVNRLQTGLGLGKGKSFFLVDLLSVSVFLCLVVGALLAWPSLAFSLFSSFLKANFLGPLWFQRTSAFTGSVSYFCNSKKEGPCHWGKREWDELLKEALPLALLPVQTAGDFNRLTFAFTHIFWCISAMGSTITMGSCCIGDTFGDSAPGKTGPHCSPILHHTANLLWCA